VRYFRLWLSAAVGSGRETPKAARDQRIESIRKLLGIDVLQTRSISAGGDRTGPGGAK
jgi:uncharacterized membrane protein